MADFWIFRRTGATRFTFAWAPDPNDKQKRKQVLLPEHIKTEREAEHYAALHAKELKGAPPRATRSRGPTVADLVGRWIKLRTSDERYAAATVCDSASLLRRFVMKPVGDIDIGAKQAHALDVPTLRTWVRALGKMKNRSGRSLAPYTIRNILRALTWLLDDIQGEGWGFLPGGNPARHHAVHSELPEMVPLAGRSQKLRIAEASEAQRLLDSPAVPVERRIRYVLDFTTGLRDGEIAGLTWADIDIGRGLVHIRKAMQLVTREGGAGVGKTKTSASVRTVPLHPAAVVAVREWKAQGWERFVGYAPREHDPVFPNPRGEHHRPRSAERFRGDIAAAGLDTHVDGHALTFHALRRSFATWLRASGAPEEARRALLGHAPKTAEERHYSEEDAAAMGKHVARIPLVWNQTGGAS